MNTMHKHVPGDAISIGRPTPNKAVYVLDDDLEPVPLGTVGTMWAAGVGVSRGYVNRPDLTKARFKPDLFTNDG